MHLIVSSFKLLDGPPYANGRVHVGHAVNKLIKDFVIRYRMANGYRVQYRPGWDCHGLPIELRVERERIETDGSPMARRRAAKALALRTVADQTNSFKRWGVSGDEGWKLVTVVADWNRPYLTMDPDYEARQLRLFWRLYSQNLIFRAFRPVHWSISSRTALADSELEYNQQHESVAVHFRFPFVNFPLESMLAGLNDDRTRHFQVYALIWTTTPWTLPLNDAICFQPNSHYLLVESPRSVKCYSASRHSPHSPYSRDLVRPLYVIAESSLHSVESALNVHLLVHTRFPSSLLGDCFYSHCLHPEVAMPLFPADHVTVDRGTGLVHSAFAHGFDDYSVALKQKREFNCYVDEQGQYTRELGHDLWNKKVLGSGQDQVLSMFAKHILTRTTVRHSYPYDWRTNEPVIVRSSAQWFIDVEDLRKKALRLVTNTVDVTTGKRPGDRLSSLSASLGDSPPWCISRQRVWGLPLPVLFDSEGRPVVTEAIVNRVTHLVEQHGSDCWWTLDIDQILTPEVRLASGLLADQVLTRGADVMDVWLDSGAVWTCLDDFHPADLVIEGFDQFRGWFRSLLLTSVAVEPTACPFRRLLVHAFAVDDNGRKMSKSEGNVVDPMTITDGSLKTDPLGVDGLRLWVASYGSENSIAKLGPNVIAELRLKLAHIRQVLRFLLGFFPPGANHRASIPNRPLDRYILSLLDEYLTTIGTHYEELAFQSVILRAQAFLRLDISSFYILVVRDRLYCDPLSSPDRQSIVQTLHILGMSIVGSLAPILPHLAAEFFHHHPLIEDAQWAVKTAFPVPIGIDKSRSDLAAVKIARLIQQQVLSLCDLPQFADVQIDANNRVFDLLNCLQSEQMSIDSQLVEITTAAVVHLSNNEHIANDDGFQLHIVKKAPNRKSCRRCRKRNSHVDDPFCSRCSSALSSLETNHLKAVV